MLEYVARAVAASLLAAMLPAQESGLSLSRRAAADAELTVDPDAAFWRGISGVIAEADYFGHRIPHHRMEVRSRWTESSLYLLFINEYEELNLKPEPSTAAETPRLWNWDVAETFLGSDFANIQHYKEFQVSPQGEWVDLDIDRGGGRRGAGDAWNSGFAVNARIDPAARKWFGAMKIPFASIAPWKPAAGKELRAGFFRLAGSGAGRKHISWQPTGRTTFHAPEKFGILRLTE
jgi:hypothetical protein